MKPPVLILQYIYHSFVLLRLEDIARWLSNQTLVRRIEKTVFFHSQLIFLRVFQIHSVYFIFNIWNDAQEDKRIKLCFPSFLVFFPLHNFSCSSTKTKKFSNKPFCIETISYCISGLSVQGQWILWYIYYFLYICHFS